MNGRAYDPLIGQFLSPDNEIQNPLFTQNYNRYGYCLNNPLSSVDLSGYNYMQLAMMACDNQPYWEPARSIGSGGRWGGGWESAHQVPYAQDYEGGEGGGTMAAWATPGTAYHYWVTHPQIHWKYSNFGKFSEQVSKEGGYSPEEPLSAGNYDIDGYTDICPGEASVAGNKKWVGLTDEMVKIDGWVVTYFSFDFAFGGGLGFSFSKVYDKNGDSDFFVSGRANIGYGIAAGLSFDVIQANPGKTFSASDYEGYSAGFTAGPFYYGGNKAEWYFTRFLDFRQDYREIGGALNLIKGPRIGGWWSNTKSKKFRK